MIDYPSYTIIIPLTLAERAVTLVCPVALQRKGTYWFHTDSCDVGAAHRGRDLPVLVYGVQRHFE